MRDAISALDERSTKENTMERIFSSLLLALSLLFISADAHAQSTFDRIKKDGVVRIGFANEAPWSYAKPDGTIAGADYDLAGLVFGKLGIANIEGVLTK